MNKRFKTSQTNSFTNLCSPWVLGALGKRIGPTLCVPKNKGYHASWGVDRSRTLRRLHSVGGAHDLSAARRRRRSAVDRRPFQRWWTGQRNRRVVDRVGLLPICRFVLEFLWLNEQPLSRKTGVSSELSIPLKPGASTPSESMTNIAYPLYFPKMSPLFSPNL